MHAATAPCLPPGEAQGYHFVPRQTGLTSTLYDVIATLQTLLEPDHDEMLVALVSLWLHCGYLSWPRHATMAVSELDTWRL